LFFVWHFPRCQRSVFFCAAAPYFVRGRYCKDNTFINK
jgi:hypothetical protein